MSVKNKLLEIRLSLGYKKQKDFAEYLEINKSQYNKYENNKEQPSIEVFYKISKKLNKKIDEIIEYEE
ncbi:helix-turn-helix transcriptional regulator [Clostridium botulinum]|uniref:helix-turn-helix transcriptional regulator n=1 Tax=Clostridium botulinum TaxID=1491 RepID=UPI0013F01A13|nr:helix-turn-helix transcriptional regulator [Clostridium botulinum]MBN1058597.1 XRE family transcriptional regulator [Clostridium botulinum]MBY7008848.1 helix-turn-helix transcriptional regulator [Clostridium botulinum]NFH73756.1 helix-turn-helix transcriptional regulator [Clostridium botulinum]NFJ73566.1 helix-turn-helix transcriptional regulator [Clostridium botulinum]NFM09849.1 helix-turn-helix transcriptional regulator [Clostridium botulinum]